MTFQGECNRNCYSLNTVEWKSILLGVILGITSFGVEIHSQDSGIYSKGVVWFTLLKENSSYFERGFPLQTKWSLIMTPKRVDLHSYKCQRVLSYLFAFGKTRVFLRGFTAIIFYIDWKLKTQIHHALSFCISTSFIIWHSTIYCIRNHPVRIYMTSVSCIKN